MLSDIELAKLCLKGKGSAHKELFDRYIKKMYAVCARYVNDKDEIKDIVQDAFIKVFNNLGSYRGDGPLEAWVRRIVVNTALTYLRKNSTDIIDRGLSQDTDIKDIADEQELYEDDNSLYQSSFSKEELLEAIEALPPNYKIVFNLYSIENYSHKEISERLDISEEGSRTRLNRARKMLQEYLLKLKKEKLSDIGL